MATKKSAITAKKSTRKSAPAAKKTTTKVTTIKAAPAAAQRPAVDRFSFSRSPLLAASIAEFIGVFLLASVVILARNEPLYLLFASIAIVLSVGAVSGSHLNPALTVGAWATRRIKSARAVSYIVAQVLGALLALVVLNGFISAAPAMPQEAAQFGQQAPELFKAAEVVKGKEWVILAAELLGTTILAFVIAGSMRVVRDKLTSAFTYGGGLFIALLITGLAAGYVGGTAVLNPAVATSVQAIKWELWPLMIYVLTPLVGGVLGFALSDLIQSESEVEV